MARFENFSAEVRALARRARAAALSQLMPKVIKESADAGILTHGEPVWIALARALRPETSLEGNIQ